jgi:hypothetical protein
VLPGVANAHADLATQLAVIDSLGAVWSGIHVDFASIFSGKGREGSVLHVGWLRKLFLLVILGLMNVWRAVIDLYFL